MSELVIDLSHHNTILNSLEPAKSHGVRGVIHKATEGSSYLDSKVQARYHLADQVGMLWGCYHFLRPGNMVQQATHFVNSMKNLGVLDDETLLAADHEDSAVSLASLMQFLLEVERLTNRVPVIYSGHVIKAQLQNYTGNAIPYRLWLAQYSSTPTLPKGFKEYFLWQYTDQGSVPGISSPVDLNRFDGTFTELYAGWSGGEDMPIPEFVPTPEPAPEPEPEEKLVEVVIDVHTVPGVKVKVTVVNPGPD